MFDADRPIQKSDQDRLNRSQFARYLARSMLDHHNPESLVAGLYGGWGSGKTSLLNLVLEELNFAASNMEDPEKPIILNFSPWSYSGQNQLIYSFFRRLSSSLRNAPYLENSERIIYLLELYVSFFTQKPIPVSLRGKRNWLEKLFGYHPEDSYGWESGRDLTQVKAELNELLRQQKHKIIILIDNISRLQPEEIKQIFQIIKSMGDYAHTSYLLALDKDQIIRAIDYLDGSGGAEFIEKVVQLPFDVPPIMQQDIESLLADRLDDVVKTVPEDAWNIQYWADVYYSSLKYFFHDCRDITRYVNTLNFGYSRLRDVVNPVDYFSLTALEVFLPDVYAGIRDNKDLFTDLLDHVYELTDEEIIHDRKRCDEILSRNHRITTDLLLALLIRLFPRIRHLYYPKIAFYHSESTARKLKRICTPDLFEIYFRLSLQSGQITPAEFETILSLSANVESFDQVLTRLNQDNRIIKFLDQLDSKTLLSIPEKNIPAVINALLDNGDLFPPGEIGVLSLDTPMRIHRIIHALLQRVPNPETRYQYLHHAIANVSKSIYTSVHELNEQGREHLEDEDSYIPLEFRDVTTDQLHELQQLAAKRIVYWAKTERLTDHPKLLPLLYAWKNWGDEESCREFVVKITQTDRGLIAFLRAVLTKAIAEAMTHYEKNPTWDNYLQDIEDFIPAQAIEDRAKGIFEDGYFEKLRENEQLAIMIFLDLIKANTRKTIPKTT